jgi:cellulose synthase/poly-beta-1,6-N-acetylglucosamine synthase-like glycosyltransferase
VRKWSVEFKKVKAKTKNGAIELNKAVFAHLLLIGFPTILIYCLRLTEGQLTKLHLAIAFFYIFSAFMLLLETSTALFRRYAVKSDPSQLSISQWGQWHHAIKRILGVSGARYPAPKLPLPRCSFLIAAYLPNEQQIIIETIEHILFNIPRPSAGLEVILTYNTPVDLPVEEDLRTLARLYPELRLLRVEGSRSKAENLNAGFEIVTGEITCILDADHHPASDCFVRAWHWINQGYDVVQGRSVIRNHNRNFLTQMIAIEFEMIYGIVHAAKSFLTDSSIFGGSNGYWRTSVLQQIRFNPLMLTEDIDASMRTLLKGYRILHDRSIISTELAPANLSSFWFQRKRWAQGWLEVGLKYQQQLWKTDKLTLWQKLFWTYLLYYCAFYPLVAIQIVSLALSLSLHHSSIPLAVRDYLWFSTLISGFSAIYQTCITAKIASTRYPIAHYIKHILLLVPYITLKNVIAIVAVYDLLRGNNDWVVTSRGKYQRDRSMLQKTTSKVLDKGISN